MMTELRKVALPETGMELVFASPRDATRSRKPLSPSHVYHEFQRCLEVAGLPRVRVHDLRHAAVSIMLADGYELPAVSRAVGHSSTTITAMLYSHALPGREAAAMSALAFDEDDTPHD